MISHVNGLIIGLRILKLHVNDIDINEDVMRILQIQ